MKNFDQINRIVIVVPLFLNGGVERWVKGLLSQLPQDKTLLIVHGPIAQEIPIDQSRLFQIKGGWRFFRLCKQLELRSSDLVIAALTPSMFLSMMAKFIFGYRFATCIQISIARQPWESRFKYIIRKLLHKAFHLTSDFMIVASSGIKSEIAKKGSQKIKIFWNPVISIDYLSESFIPINERESIILGVGRLERQKGFDRLIKAGHMLKGKGIENFKILIIGEGTLRPELDELVSNLGMEGLVQFHNFTDDIYEYYKKAKVFVLSSLYEGFGNVLAEALASNCYCISFDVAHGPSDILGNGRFGKLIDEDISQLAHEIEEGLSFSGATYTSWDSTLEQCNKFTSEYYLKTFVSTVDEYIGA